MGSYAEPSATSHTIRETIAYYNATSGAYAKRFANTDLLAHRRLFESWLPNRKGLVLDAGCGPGRDCSFFQLESIRSIGIDLSRGLLSEARKITNAPLIEGDYRFLPFRDNVFDGIWACASLLHISIADMKYTLQEFSRTLLPGAALFISVRHGVGEEWREAEGGRRWFQLYSPSDLEELLIEAGFHIRSTKLEAGIAHGEWVNAHARSPL